MGMAVFLLYKQIHNVNFQLGYVSLPLVYFGKCSNRFFFTKYGYSKAACFIANLINIVVVSFDGEGIVATYYMQ
jgi:hypothetical protein